MRPAYQYFYAESNIEKKLARGQKRENRLKNVQNGCYMMEVFFPNAAVVFPRGLSCCAAPPKD